MNIKLLAVGTLAIASLGDAASSSRTKHPRVVVIGGGFAGLGAATTLQVSMIPYRINITPVVFYHWFIYIVCDCCEPCA